MGHGGRPLAGRFGIPLECERTYVSVELVRPLRAGAPQVNVPVAVTWPDGRSWPIERVLSTQEYGRRSLDNLVTRWNVLILDLPKVIWSEGGRWFVVAKHQRGDKR
ncbi:hypothetical protein [Thermophilibacter mediterraneus]|uniref:hypothetical protein n=1 Tax=Thermophilibacter mediterraneus TaxID=1871031 RepID=UPI002355D729|nr:hypothetical protein [Thermophilibacter mediterraneus]